MVLAVVAYDIETGDSAGKARLRKAARLCLDCGQRVQGSVYEVYVDASGLAALEAELRELIDPATDSVRIYRLGRSWREKVTHMGAKPAYDPSGFLCV